MGGRLSGWAGQAGGLLLAAVLVAGCGDTSSETADDTTSPGPSTDASSPSATTSAGATDSVTSPAAAPAGTPGCADVWQADAVLPKAYAGCADAGGLLVAPDRLGCSSGQALVRHDDRFWAVRGGTIHDAGGALLKSDLYQDAVKTCRG